MRTHRILFALLMIGTLVSCSTGKKALQKGNYADAVFKAVERLRSSPDNKKARTALKSAYPLAVSTLETEIEELLRTNDPNKYAFCADKYQTLNDMANEIRRSPVALQLIPSPKTYTNELTAVKDKAAEEAYINGKRFLANGTREEAREAYYAFEACLDFNPEYKDARQLLTKAKEIATLKVLVEPISVPGRYKLNSDFFYNDILSNLNKDHALEFVQFMNDKEAKQYRNIDQILVMEFFDFQVGATKEEKKERELTSKDSVKVGSATINGNKVDVYDKVSATFISNKREVSSDGVMMVKIIDGYTKKVLENKPFPGSFVWVTEWASYNGDKRALTKEELDLCQKKPANAPAPQDLFYEFTKPIYNQTISFLRNYYRKF